MLSKECHDLALIADGIEGQEVLVRSTVDDPQRLWLMRGCEEFFGFSERGVTVFGAGHHEHRGVERRDAVDGLDLRCGDAKAWLELK
jgi:hypothetical protein